MNERKVLPVGNREGSLICPGLHRFAVLTAGATFLLLGAGGLVTSHGVGMAVPDWPNTYGYNMFFFPFSKWVGGVFYEHTHRLLASGVGLLTAILALWLYGRSARPFLRWTGLGLLALAIGTVLMAPKHWTDAIVLGVTGLSAFFASRVWPRCEPSPRWMRRCGLAAFVAVVLQGVLGGLRVVLFKDQIGIFHATLAQLFFALTCALALLTSRAWQEAAASGHWLEAGFRPPLWLSRLVLTAALLILAQLVLGATMRHQHAGLAIPDFPMAYGKLWPAMDPQSVARYNQQRIEVLAVHLITAFQILLQMLHRLMAALILGLVALCAGLARRRLGTNHPISRLTLAWSALIIVQALLGAATIWSDKAADIATAHVLVGALSLALAMIVCIMSFWQPVFDHSPVEDLVASGTLSAARWPQRPWPVGGLD
ncbi:MAG TPA: COX15/CtaA family protein [Verrucomicrobiae bacterium]|nr:COX15/CtaA family protein [Verrucomicrobiae bacterium]